MATLPFPINGVVYDTDGTTAMASVKVTLRNERTNETISTTTNASGQYILDCANLASQYADGDVVTVFIIYTNYEDYEEYTIDESVGGKEINLTLVAVPASDSLKYFKVQDFYDFFHLVSGAEDTPLTNEIVSTGTMAETEIDNLTGQSFYTNDSSYTTITQEYHDAVSEFQLDWFTEKTPIVSVTTFQVNTASDDSAESWVTLTEAAGQIEVSKDTGRIRCTGTVGDATTPVYPAAGVNQVRITYTYGQATPNDIKKLAILMVGRDLMQGSVSRALFRGQDSFKTDHYTVLDKQIDTILARYRKVDMYNT